MSELDTIARRHAEVVRALLPTTPPPLEQDLRGRHAQGRPRVATLVVAVVALALMIAVPLLLRGTESPVVVVPPPVDGLTPDNGLILVHRPVGLVAVDGDGRRSSSELALPTVSQFVRLAWSPDGRELVHWSTGVTVFDTTTGSERTVYEGCRVYECSVAWSPDGSVIAVLESETLHLVDPGDGTDVGVVDLPEMGSPPLNVIWSSTGDWIILSYVDETWRLIGVHPDGSDPTLFYEGATESLPGSFAWSSELDGVVVLLKTHIEVSDSALDAQLSVVTARPGEEPRHVADVGRCACLGLFPGLTVSPDGSLIAMNVPGIGEVSPVDLNSWGLYLMEVDGSNLERIGVAGLGDPVWQPVP